MKKQEKKVIESLKRKIQERKDKLHTMQYHYILKQIIDEKFKPKDK